MLKLMIKELNGEVKSLDVTENLVITPKAGQQFYFNNLDGHKYTMNLQDSEKSVVLNMDLGTTKVKIVFKNIVDLILEENVEDKNILGIIKDEEGLEELNQTVLNNDFKGDDVIKSLKDLLAQSSINPEETNGVIIDDFGSLNEDATSATVEVKLEGHNFKDGETVTVKLSDGTEVTFTENGTKDATITVTADSDSIKEADSTTSITAEVSSSAGEIENPVVNAGELTVEDSIDTTTVTVGNATVNEDATSATVEVKLEGHNFKDGETVTVKLSDGTEVTFTENGTKDATITVTADSDSIKEADSTTSITAEVSSSAGEIENPVVNAGELTVEDSIDTTTVTVGNATVNEDATSATVEVKLEGHNFKDGETVTVKLSDGTEVTFTENGTKDATITVTADSDSIKEADSTTSITAEVSSSAGEIENPVVNAGELTVEDSIDTTTVTVGNATVNEDATSATVEVKLEGHNFKDGETVTVKLSDGTEVTFTENGTKDATITVTADSDSIKEADSTTSITAEVSSSAGEIENPVVNAGELTVEDSIDTTTVTVGNATVNEDATSATVEVKLEGHNFKDGETVTVKLSDGTEVTFTENGTKDATITVTADSDSIKEADSTTSITAEVSSSAGEIENPVVNAGELTVEDSIDTTTVTVGNATVNEDATSATVEVKLEGHNFKDGETVTVKLSDGTEVTFTENGTKDATITVTADSDSIKEADSTTSITAEVSSSAGEIENPVVNAGELTVEDSIDTTTVTVGNATVNEDATSATVEVKLEGHNFKDGETVTVKLSDGTEVTFTENGTKDATITVTADSDSIKEADSTTSITAEVSSSAGEIENPVVNAGELTVEDSIDTTTVTVGNATVNEDATSATVEVKLEGHNFKDGETVTVKLSDGTEVTFTENGTKDATITVTADSDSIKEADSTTSITAEVSSSAGEIENPVVNAGELTVEDSIDTTTVTVGNATVNEDATSATVEVKLEGHNFKDGETVTVKLSDGTEVTFTENGTKDATITVTADSDSIKEADSTTSITAEVSSSAGEIENPVVNAGELTVEDSIDTTTVTVGNATVNEDATSATVEVKLEGHNFKDGETVTVKLSDGTEVTFTENGTKDATITVTADSDSIKEADSTTSITAEVSSSAGEIENPVVNAGELTVEDSIDTTTVTVGNATVNEDATSATVEVKLEGHNFKDGETVTVKLSDGTEVTFTENGTKDATITVTADSDSIKEADSTTSITAEVSSSAGEIENPVVNAGELTVEDSIDTTTVTVGNATVNEDATSATVEVKLEGHNFKDGETVTVKLSDGTEVTFTENGTKDATITVTADSDSIKEADSTTSITAEVSSSAGEIENPVVNAGELTVEDSIDTTTVTVGNATVNEDATSATVEVKLEGHNFKDGETVTVKLSDGTEVTFTENGTKDATITVTADSDSIKEADSTTSITAEVSSSAGEIENPVVNAGELTVEDSIDTTTVTVGNATVNEDATSATVEVKLEGHNFKDGETVTVKLSDGTEVTFTENGTKDATITVTADSDSIKEADSTTSITAEVSSSAGEIENPVVNAGELTVEDSIDTTTVTVGNATVNEDATSATVEVKLEGHNFKDGETVTVKLSDGTEVTFTENGTKDATITVTADSDSIKEADSTTSITAEVSSSAGEIENPVVNAGELTVEDSIDTTTVTVGNATVNEDATSATVEVKLEGHNFKDGETVTVKLSDGTEVTFTENGTKDATITVTADSDSIKEADSTTSITAEVSSSAGEIENPVVNAGELTVEDSIDTTTVTVGNATVNEDATSATVEVKLEGHNFKDGETVTVKLSDGTEVTFTENGTKDATITVTADSDSIKEADSTTSITAEVSSSAGEIENPVVNAGELTVEDSIDTTTVTVGNATVNEDATSATVEVKLEGHNFKDGETVTVKLSDGTEVTFTENGTKDATITVTADSDSIKEADSTTSITAEVSSSAGEIENPVVNAGELTVEDSIDTTTVTVGNATVNEDATSATVEVKLEGHNFKDGETVTVKLSDGTEVTFTENGTKDATITVTADSDSIKEADSTTSITAEVSSSAGEIENPVVNAGELTVEDSIDTTTVTVGNATVNEDATSATVEVKLEGHNFKDGETVTVKLSDGTEVTFTENGTKDATITVTADSDSIKEADSTTSITAEVSSSAGEIENPVVNAGELTVEDSIDTTTVTVGNATVNEDATSATVEVKLEGHNFKDGETVTVKLSDGTEVTFTENGTKDATITVTADSDSIKEADSTTSITAEVSSSAGEIENPVVNAGELTVEDSIDTTTVTVGNATVNEDATSATVEVKLEGHNFKDGETVTVKLSDGTEVTFTENGTKDATITVTADSDSIKEADSTTSITAEVSSSAGEIENPVVNAGELTVEDSIDTTTVSLSATDTNEAAGTVIFTATLTNEVRAEDPKVVVHTELGDIIIQPKGTVIGQDAEGNDILSDGLTGTLEVTNPNTEDVYNDASTLDNSITSVEGGNFEQLKPSTDTVTANIADTITPIDVTVTAVATAPKVIDVDTEFGEATGINVTAYDVYGNEGNLAIVKGTNHDGFGVQGNTSGSGASSELGHGYNGVSEKIVFDFTNDADSLDVAFAWRHNGETAKVTFFNDTEELGYAEVTGGGSSTDATVNYYDVNGNLIKSVQAQGGTDRVDLSYTFEFPDANGEPTAFDKVEFSAPGHDDDYLINEISYTEVIDPEITDINTSEGKVTFNIQVDENYPPQGQAKAIVEVNGQEYEVDLNATGRGALTVDAKDFDDLSDINIVVKEIVGGNYEKVNGTDSSFDLSDSFKDDLSSTNDNIVVTEDTTYVLTETDFGELGKDVREFKITQIPENGTLYYKVTSGQTVIDKEGNTYVVTEDTTIEIAENQVISLADIASGKVTFEPDSNSDEDGSFKFEVSDGTTWHDEEYTTSVEVKAVADAPTASINVSNATVIIDNSDFDYDNYVQELKDNSDTYIEGTESHGDNLSAGRFNNTDDFIDGKDLSDNMIGYDGDDVFLGQEGDDSIYGGHEGALPSVSDGTDTVIYRGNFDDYNITFITEGSNVRINVIDTRYDASKGWSHPDNQGLDTYEMGDNLYSIEKLVFKDGVYDVIDGELVKEGTKTFEYDVDISATLTDTDGSETLSVKIDGVPEGATLESIDDTYTITKNSDGSYSVEVPSDATSISDNLKLKVPEDSAGDFNLTITARASESNDNDDGTNYKETTNSDAVPFAQDESQVLDFGDTYSKTDENIVIVLDISGSMKDYVQQEDGSWTTRLQLAKDALQNMVDTYKEFSNVKINLTKFEGRADALDGGESESGWYSPEDALKVINNFSAGGGTNYEDALEETYSNYTPPANGEKATVYFISDGKPNVENNDGWYDEYGIIDSKYLENWKDFLENNAKELNVIGIGKGITDTTYLDKVAQDVGNVKTNVTIIEDENDLKDRLVENVYKKIEGNILDNISGGDGEISVESIVVDGNSYTIDDASNNIVTILTSSGATLDFNFETGDYSFGGNFNDIKEFTESFVVNTQDEDGDKASVKVNINIENNIDDTVTTPRLDFSVEDNGSQVITHDYDVTKDNSDYYGERYTNEAEYIKYNDDVKGTVQTFGGDDVVYVGDDIKSRGAIYLGNGDDFITVEDKVSGYVFGGEGNDSIYLKDYTYSDYYYNKDYIQNHIKDFENIKFKDGHIIGDSNAFNSSPMSTTIYNYTIVLAAVLADKDGSETLSNITIENLPSSITSIKDSSGNEYTVSNGTVSLPSNEGTQQEYTVVSSTELSSTEINSMKASVTSTESFDGEEKTTSTTAKLEVEESSNMIGTDADEKFDSHSSNATINAGAGDDEIIYHEGDIIDAGEGEDTLKVLTDEDIDLSNIAPKVDNIEAIDLTNDLANHIIVDEQSIEDLTDDENILKIFGDESGEDSVRLEGNWTKSDGQISDDDGNTFNVYEGTTSGTSNIKILIDEDVSVDPDI
ncbi:immunoglobulin-like domain-containing protein [Malaciobacter marinus]|uniref:immunoglobulin-like domain-containing protein n=1 Tax=Malaciobacter marinus TaxID=505249 RepID=UPI003C7925F8